MTTIKAIKSPTSHARVLKYGSGTKAFTSGLLLGLSSASLLFAGQMPFPKASKEGLESDWKSVGSDIATAIGKYGR